MPRYKLNISLSCVHLCIPLCDIICMFFDTRNLTFCSSFFYLKCFVLLDLLATFFSLSLFSLNNYHFLIPFFFSVIFNVSLFSIFIPSTLKHIVFCVMSVSHNKFNKAFFIVITRLTSL